MKVKSEASDRGADRIYTRMLSHDEGRSSPAVLAILARCLDSVRPSPVTVRRLAEITLDQVFRGSYQIGPYGHPLPGLFESSYAPLVAVTLTEQISNMIASKNPAQRIDALHLICELVASGAPARLGTWARELSKRYFMEILDSSAKDSALAQLAFIAKVISTKQALSLPSGMDILSNGITLRFIAVMTSPPYLLDIFSSHVEDAQRQNDLTLIGRFLTANAEPPWTQVHAATWKHVLNYGDEIFFHEGSLTAEGSLGLAAACAVIIECTKARPRKLPDWPVPPQFKQLFRDWAEGKVDFVRTPEG